MKKILFSLLLCLSLKASAQSIDDYVSFASSLVEQKEYVIGQTLDVVYNAMTTSGISPRWVSTRDSSPFVHPEGKSFVKGVILFSNSLDELKYTNAEFVEIVISIEDIQQESDTFWRTFPDNKHLVVDYFMDRTKNYVIKNIKYRVTSMDDLKHRRRMEYIE